MLPKILRSLSPIAFVAAAFNFVAPAPLVAQATSSLVTTRLTQPIDENSRVTLKGTVNPLATAANDRGAASDSMPLDRIQIVLKRSDAQESALKQLIGDLHTPGSASYHKWLTPDAFGKQFGPSDPDIATLEAWLQSKGFSITKLNPGKQTLEISGNVSQFREAFHTQINKYLVNGETHYANATDPQIPAALAPVVSGFASLNNFRPKSYARKLGEATYNTKTSKTTPEWTLSPSANEYQFALSPGDYAVQYDLNPLYSAGINGTGQTIAIVNESNINIYLVNQFRSLFGLPANPPQVIIDGNDPGVDGINNPDGPNGASVEAYLDVEWSGAVAPNATVDLVIAADTALENGLFLALQRAIFSDVAPVVSISFGNCEKTLGNTNQFLNAIFEQAAAQGQTVLVSTGDSGSAGCDDDTSQYYAVGGQAVSGWASTPYNVAVGGTDFYYSAWNQGSTAINNQLMTYWKSSNGSFVSSNNTPAVSIQGVIPEQPWNESQFGLNINSVLSESGNTVTSIAGGSGGASNCATGTYDSNGNTVTCTAGYPKPSWQTGTGVPADHVRDIPDLSLFASSGINDSFYVICATDGDCQPVSSSDTVQIFGVGGTSASTPSFAGFMALINQKYGPQGQANYVLYPLAAQFSAAFHDVTNGTNSVPCSFNPVSPNCISVTGAPTITDPNLGAALEGQIGTGTTAEYNATAGYDLATGLGTIDANVMFNDWGKISFTTPAVTLSSPTANSNLTHGSSVTFTASVTGTSPTGQVALMTSSTEANNQGIANATLNSSGTATGTTTLLPGGTYNVWAHYGGDGKNAQANSQPPTSITVTPEASGVFLNVIATGSGGGLVPNGTTNIPYGTGLSLSAQVAPFSKLSAVEACFNSNTACPVYGMPTGVVTFSDSGTAIKTAVLNAEGDVEYNTIDQTVPVSATKVGKHSITASYAGDNSYNASSASATTYTIVQATPTLNVSWPNPNGTLYAGQTSTLTLYVQSTGTGAPPTGTVTISGAPSGTTPTTATLSLSGVDLQTGVTQSYATFTLPASTGSGNYGVTLTYNGDSNYTSAQASGTITVSAKPSQTPTTTVITTSGSSTSPSSLVGITITVTGAGTTPPTGTVTLQTSGYSYNPLTLVPNTGTDTSSVSISVNSSPGELLQGANVLTASYSGDTNYAPSTSAAVNLANPLSDFAMVPESTIVAVPSSGSATEPLNITSTNSFSGVVNLTCSGAGGVGCSFDNAAPSLTAGGTAGVNLTVNNNNVSKAGTYNVMVTGQDSTGTYIHTLALQAVVASATTLPQGLNLTAPSSLTIVNPGDSDSGALGVSAQGGVSGQVTYSCTVEGSPAGITCSAPNSTITSVSANSTLTVSTTSAAVPMTYTADITATADSVTSNTVKVPITLNPNAGFALSGANIPSLAPGATTGNTSTITVAPSGGFTGTVNLSCSLTSSPSGAMNSPTCSIPSTVSVTSGNATATMTISSTAATSGTLARPLDKFFAVGGGITVAGLLLFGIPARRRSWRAILGVLVFAAIVGMSIGCGGSGSGGGGGGGGSTGTTAGTYTFTVTGTSGSLTPQSAQVTVTFN
jgi:trimeric autotransporter adhesin